MFAGKKTYILAVVTVISAVASFLVGDATLGDTIQLCVTALTGAFLRHGIATATK